MKIKILILFSGIGGNRTSWGNEYDITAIEFESWIADIYKARFPLDLVKTEDAMEFLRWNFEKYDIIWISPPCKTHTNMTSLQWKNNSRPPISRMDQIYGVIDYLRKWGNRFGKCPLWIIENVVPGYVPLVKPTVKLNRHLYWSNFPIPKKKFKKLVKFNIPRKKRGIKYETPLDVIALANQIDYNWLISNFKLTKIQQRTILRNCDDYRVGEYILDCAIEFIKGKKIFKNADISTFFKPQVKAK